MIRRLAILGAAGVTGEPLALAFEQLEALWADPPDGTAPLSALRRHAAPRIATALAAAPEALARWRSEAGLADPLWEVFDSTSAHDGSALRAALATRDPEVRDPARSYLLGVAALRNGQPTLALKLLGRLDSIPLGVTVRDPGWGLRSLALFHRGETYEALGDPAQAAALYLRFLETRTPGDDTAPFQAAALDRLARLQESGSTQGVVDDVPRSPTP